MRCPTISELPDHPPGKRSWPWTEESTRLPDTMPDGQPWPRISIVTPSYNQGQFIEETIRSVLLQGYPAMEYIIMDGGSTDNSVRIIEKYKEWLAHWVSEPDRGQSDAINKGLGRASGEIYTWLNSDDFLTKDALKNVAMAYRASPTTGGWFGGCSFADAGGSVLGVRWPNRLDAEGLANWKENWVIQPACFFSREAWQRCGPLDEDLYYGMDFDLLLSIAKEFSIERVNSLLAVARRHEGAKTQVDAGQMHAIQCLIQFRHGYERYAIQDISQWMNEYVRYRKRLARIYRFLPLRMALSSAGAVKRKLL